MATNPSISPDLHTLCEALDALSEKVVSSTAENRTMQELWGWQFPPLNRISLSRAARDLASAIRRHGPETVDAAGIGIIGQAKESVEKLNGVVQYIFNGNGNTATPIYLGTLSRIREDLETLLGWQPITDSNQIPSKMARRLRSFQATLEEIEPDAEALKGKIKLINEAHEAAESL